MYQATFGIRPVMLSGHTRRPPVFAPAVASVFHYGLAGGAWLGQAPMEWYRRAKTAIAKFDDIRSRIARISARTERERLQAALGSQAVKDSPIYSYNAVKSDLSDVERTTPLEEGARQYEVKRRQNRITELEGHNSTLEPQVASAESVYGTIPAPTVIERERVVQAPPAEGPGLALPLLVGGGAVATALIISLLAG